MDDATFLKQCGIEADMCWLAEIMSRYQSADDSNYADSLLREANILDKAD
jgi:hypothetical protein